MKNKIIKISKNYLELILFEKFKLKMYFQKKKK